MLTVSWFTLAREQALVTQVSDTLDNNTVATDQTLARYMDQLGFHLTACACRTTKYECNERNRNLIAA